MTLHITGHHKTGTQWLIKIMLYLAQRNGFTFMATHLSVEYGTESGAYCHFTANACYQHIPSSVTRAIHIIRDPLDILVSAYYSHARSHPTNGWDDLARHRAALLACGTEAGYQLEMAYLFSHNFQFIDGSVEVVAPFAALETWNWDDPRFLTIRMEDLTSDPEQCFRRMFAFADKPVPDGLAEAIGQASFDKMSGGRQKGAVDDNSHYRRGLPGEWRNTLPPATVEAMRVRFKDLLQRFYPETLA
jgi:Sulfotransferase domain